MAITPFANFTQKTVGSLFKTLRKYVKRSAGAVCHAQDNINLWEGGIKICKPNGVWLSFPLLPFREIPVLCGLWGLAEQQQELQVQCGTAYLLFSLPFDIYSLVPSHNKYCPI